MALASGLGNASLLQSADTFGSEWLDALRLAGTLETPVDLLMIGDFGKDQDDEKALAMAVSMRRQGLISSFTVVANFGDAAMRARLAKGTLNALGAHDVRVAVGTDGGRPGEEIHEYEFAACPYLAPESELHAGGGHELAFAALREAKAANRQLAVVLNSALTDMAAVVADPRWAELAPDVVSSVVVMGGVTEDADGRMRMDPTAANCAFDVPAAEAVHAALEADKRIPFAVVTRHCAAACQLPRCAFDGSSHPVALRLTSVARPSLQMLWQRVHRSEDERKEKRDGLPMRCDPAWFRTTFLESDMPSGLGANDEIWEYVRGFNEYDGLATVVATTMTHADLFGRFFAPHTCPATGTLVIGRNAKDICVADTAMLSQLLHCLMVISLGPGAGEWYGRLASHDGSPVDLLMIGDFGKDQDDEKALAMAVSMRRQGLISSFTVVANFGDAAMRARLAKGTLNALGAHDVRVAVGTDGGRPGEEIHEYEFAACPYLAPESELHAGGGHELAFAALREAKAANRQLAVVLNSALTDMAAVVADPRWAELAPDVVSSVVVMGGVTEDADGRMRMDPTAANCAFDVPAAEAVHAALEADKRIPFAVVTRHCAAACQLPRCAFDGSSHPVALRLTSVARPSLQMLWQRVHRSEDERKEKRDGLPMRCDPAWFRTTFLESDMPSGLGANDEIWEYVRGFNEYDGLATVVATTMTHADLFGRFFAPHTCPATGTLVIGRNAKELCIPDGPRASELLHDLLVGSFERIFRKGLRIEVKLGDKDGAWTKAVLARPARSKGPDSWVALAFVGKGIPPDTDVQLAPSTEGIKWRLEASVSEPIHSHARLGFKYRKINGIICTPYFMTAGYWTQLREGFCPRPGDIFAAGFKDSGNTLAMTIAAVLLSKGDINRAYDLMSPAPLELDIARGMLDLQKLAAAPAGPQRVWKTFHPYPLFPCVAGADGGLPPGLKVLCPLRDPRDACISTFAYMKRMGQFPSVTDETWEIFVEEYTSGEMVFGGWLRSVKSWADARARYPKQVLLIGFEELVNQRELAARCVASFLGLKPSAECVRRAVEASAFAEAKKRLVNMPFIHPDDAYSPQQLDYRTHFTQEQLRRFETHLIEPAIAHGIPLRDGRLQTLQAAKGTKASARPAARGVGGGCLGCWPSRKVAPGDAYASDDDALLIKP